MLIERFYEKLFNAISDAFFSEINNAKSSIPEKGNKRFLKVFDAMLAFCARALNAIKASCLNSEFGAEHKLLSQMPITNFLQSIEGGKEMTLRLILLNIITRQSARLGGMNLYLRLQLKMPASQAW